MKRLLSMTRAQLLMTVRARQALFWNLAFPIIVLGLLSVVIGNGSAFNATVGVVGKGPLADATRHALASIKDVKLKTGSEAEERQALKNGDRDAVLVIPDETPATGHPVVVQMLYDNTNLSQSSAIVSLVSQVVQGVDRAYTHRPELVMLSSQGINAVNNSYVDFLAPGIIAMSIMTGGVLGISGRMVGYREQKILKRLRATPLSTVEFVLANVLSQLVVVLAQVVILMLVATQLFNVKVVGDIPTLILFALLGGLAFLTIGFAISGLAKTGEAANALGNVVTMPMMFLSGVYFPISGAPEWLKPLIGVLPLTYLANGMRDIVLRGVGAGGLGIDALVLAITSVLGCGVATRTFRWE
ncbi:MAG TPA: ABC transporter permease [Chloroflexota bacterium]|nr:ABC transporter permease [Chloroflexota bacterium]